MVPSGGALRRTTTTGSARPDTDRSRPWTTRLQRELERLWADTPEGCLPGADAAPGLLDWRVVVIGPGQSPYEGGVFAVRFKFPRDYPFKPPKVSFETKVYHPNVDPRTGLVCLEFLTDRSWWTPVWSVEKIMLVVASLLVEPVMDGAAVNREAAYLYRRKRPRFEEIARAKTREHASASSPETERPSSRGVSQLWRRVMRTVAFLRSSG